MSFNKVIFPIIKFKTPELQEFLEDVRKVKVTKVSKDAFERNVKIGNLVYTVATGGLHSQDPPRALYSNTSPTGGQDSYTYVHWDISDAVSR